MIPRHSARKAKSSKKTHIQTLLFSKAAGWTKARAVKYAQSKGYEHEIDEKPETYRLRQLNPDIFVKSSFRTIELGKGTGIKAVIGHLKPEFTDH
jgi:hypothetical protein